MPDDLGDQGLAGVKFGPIQLLGRQPDALKVKGINYDDPNELTWRGPIRLKLISVLETVLLAIQESALDGQELNSGD